MGQQQLLLVILVTILVGIATVVAINTFSSASDNANIDAARNDIAQIASSAQGYYMKPAMMGGGGNTFTGITFDDIAFPTNGNESTGALKVTNENGTYEITVSASNIAIDATPAQAGGLLEATVEQDGITDAGITYDPAGTELTAVSSGG